MIYIIIGTDTATGNEWVETDTFDNAAEAAERCTILRSFPEDVTYRIETVEPDLSDSPKTITRLYADKQVAEREAAIKPISDALKGALKGALNDAYGKAKMDHEEQHYAYRDTDSGRFEATEANGDFTVKELFGNQTGKWVSGIRLALCGECGALVQYGSKHVIWHNKLLP